MKASGGVAEKEFDIAAMGARPGVVTEGGGVAAVLAFHHVHSDAFAPGLELFDGRSAKGIGCDQEAGMALALEPMGHLGGRGGFSRAIHTHHQKGLGFGWQGADGGIGNR